MEPEAKRMKLDKTQSSNTRMECVLADEFLEEIPTTSVYIGKILEKKNTRRVILDLNTVNPIPSLQHLKRVKDGDKVILCLANGIKDIWIFLKELGFDTTLISTEIETLSVASEIPKTRKQFENSNKVWPCNFHEDKYLEKLLGNSFTNEEIIQREKFMQMALDINGTVIVNPLDNTILCSSSDFRTEHPLKHSVMVAIDNVASSQGGGAWSLPMSEVPKRDKNVDGPYLCTGYDVYTVREPCLMCAMALVHSRAKRIFYSISQENGALGTKLKLHAIKSLNHHFEVFCGLLRKKSLKLTKTLVHE